MYTSLSCLFSFSCPRPHLSPDHPAGRSQDKPRRLRRGFGFWCCLMSAWDLVTQRAPKVPLRTDARTALRHPAPSSHLRTAGACLVLSAASLSSSSPIALPPLLLSYSFSLHPEQSRARLGLACSAFLCLRPSRSLHSFQQPPRTFASGWLVLPLRAYSYRCCWFVGFGGPYKWTETITIGFWSNAWIISLPLYFYISFASSL